MRTEDQGRR